MAVGREQNLMWFWNSSIFVKYLSIQAHLDNAAIAKNYFTYQRKWVIRIRQLDTEAEERPQTENILNLKLERANWDNKISKYYPQI